MALTVAIRRFDPRSDRQPYWASYGVDLDGRKTVLDALLDIEARCDPTLAFRRTCRSGICGACAGLVNGRPCLFCQSRLQDAGPVSARVVEADVLLEPLPPFRVLKDLVVDMDPFLDELREVEAWLIPNREYGGTVAAELSQKLWGPAKCVLCGICAGLTSRPGLPHPAAIARVLRLAFDPRDAIGPDRLRRLDALDRGAGNDLARRLTGACPAEVDIGPLMNQAVERARDGDP